MASKTIEVDLRPRLSGVATIAPGDTLVVTLAGPCSAEDAAHVRDSLLALPGLADVIVVDNATGLAVYRPDEEGAS